MESSSEEVDLRLPVFLLTLPDASCVTFTRLAFCVWFEVKWKIYCVADVLSYTLPLKISWQSDWWQILVTVVVLRKIVFPQLLPFLYIRYNFMKVLQICSQSLTPFVSLWTGSLFGERVKKSARRGKRGRACRQTFGAAVPRHPLCIRSWCKLFARTLPVDRFQLHRFFSRHVTSDLIWIIACKKVFWTSTWHLLSLEQATMKGFTF